VQAGTDAGGTRQQTQAVEQDAGASYLKLLAPRIVRNFGESIEEMVDGGFSLKADGMEELEGGDGDGALGVIGCRGVPAVREQLLPVQL
jgi:hypothetical protein